MADPVLFEFGSWLNGVLLDRWSLIHFLYGVLFAFLFRMMRMSRGRAYLLAFSIMIGWEIYEEVWGPVEDSVWNAVSDVVVASLGFWLVHRLFPVYRFVRDGVLSLGLGFFVLILMLASG